MLYNVLWLTVSLFSLIFMSHIILPEEYWAVGEEVDQQTTTLPLLLAPLLSKIVFNTDLIKVLHTWAAFSAVFNVYFAG